MRFDTIIIGGGLSGLTCGITLAKTGKRVAIVATGQSTMHFNGGAMELLGSVDGKPVADPIAAIDNLPESHPYRKLGAQRVEQLANEAKQMLLDVGINLEGDTRHNHWRITPIGVTKPAWLSLRGMATCDAPDQLPWKQVSVLNLNGFIDLPIDFLCHNLRQRGVQVTVKDIRCDFLANARRSATEMRATNLARTLTSTSRLRQLAEAINQVTSDDEAVLMPAVVGLDSSDIVDLLRAQVKAPLQFVATMPPSVPGTRMEALLRHYFRMLGGTCLTGDTVHKAVIEDGRVKVVHTTKLQDMPLRADNFVLAAGSFMSQGLMATSECIYEPLFGLDTDAPADRDQWSHYGLMGNQPFMACGVLTDNNLYALKDGKAVQNLHAIGAILGGHNPVVLGDGTGVDMVTALAAAHDIMGNSDT